MKCMLGDGDGEVMMMIASHKYKLGFQDINMILRMVMTWGSGQLRWEARSLCGNHTRPDATQRTAKYEIIR